MKEITLTFSYPPPELLPNKKLSWQEKMKITKQARRDAYLMGLNQICRGDRPLIKAMMMITWYPSSRRLADDDSQYCATKPIRDGGLVDAGFIAKDSPEVIKMVILRYGEVDKENPRTEIRLWGEEMGELGKIEKIGMEPFLAFLKAMVDGAKMDGETLDDSWYSILEEALHSFNVSNVSAKDIKKQFEKEVKG